MAFKQSKEEVMEYVRHAPEKEKWAWLAGELWDGRNRMDEQESRIDKLPCRDWHGSRLKWLTGIIWGGASGATLYLLYLAGQRIFGVTS